MTPKEARDRIVPNSFDFTKPVVSSTVKSTLQYEADLTHTVLSRLRDTPNEHISQLQNELGVIADKIKPMLDRVEQAQKNIEIARATHGNYIS